MREARLTVAGIDFVLGNKGDVVKLLSVEVESKQLAVLQDLRKGLVCVEMEEARVSGHKQCRLTLADDGKSTLKLDVVGQLGAEDIDQLRPLQRQSRAEEIAEVVAGLGDGADREDIAEAVDDLLRFDAVVTPLQLQPEDMPEKKPARKKADPKKPGQNVLEIEPGEKPREFAKRAFRKLKGDMQAEGVDFSVSRGGIKRVAKAAGKKAGGKKGK